MFQCVLFTVCLLFFVMSIFMAKVPYGQLAMQQTCLQKLLKAKVPRTSDSRVCVEKLGPEDQERNLGWTRNRDVGLREVSLKDGSVQTIFECLGSWPHGVMEAEETGEAGDRDKGEA